jgi:hypothetical protein
MTQPALPAAPAAPAAPTPSPTPAPAAPATPAWYEGAAPELAAFAAEQGWVKADDALASARGHLKLRGVKAEELMHLKPGWDATPETAAEVYARLGRPEKADQYEIPDIPVGEGDRNLSADFKAWAHEAGLTPKQATALATKYQGALKDFATEQQGKLDTKLAADEIALKAEWGGAYEENVAAGKRAYQAIGQAIGMTAEDLGAMERSIGHGKVMKLMALIGRTTGEHQTVTGESAESQFGLTPASATAKANALTAELSKMKREDPRYKDMLAEITRLNFVATGETVPGWLKAPGSTS